MPPVEPRALVIVEIGPLGRGKARVREKLVRPHFARVVNLLAVQALDHDQRYSLSGGVSYRFGGTLVYLDALYGSGLRVSEPLNLRVKDVRFERRELILKAAKNSKDRVVRLPEAVIPELQQQMRHARRVWQQDVQDGIPVTLPHQLARKYPEYQFSWPWAFVFPMHKPCKHPRTHETVRWRMMSNIVQKAVKFSRRRLGIQVVPHELRHAYATHCLDRGVNLKALQEAMGHVQIETTAGYCHAEALSVASPLDALPQHAPPNLIPFHPNLNTQPADQRAFLCA